MDQRISLRLEADLFLLHAPSVYDFRERDDAGVKGVMVWFFIGMPYQDRQSTTCWQPRSPWRTHASEPRGR
jgi:hypothetical protein